jgi:hypothetical protein
MDLSNYKKIKYEQESNMSSSTSRLDSALIISLIILVFSAIVSIFTHKKYGLGAGLIMFSVLIGFLLFVRYKTMSNTFTEMRQTFIDQGTLFIGVIIEVKEYETTAPQFYSRYRRFYSEEAKKALRTKHFYKARYIDAENEEQIIETGFIQAGKVDQNAVGKKCTIYKYDGHHMVDSIEN